MSEKTMTRRQVALMTTIGVAAAAGAAATAPAEAAIVRQPAMVTALTQLEAARRSLMLATPDKGGHRARALSYVNTAIAEVRAGMAFDNRRR